MGITVNSPFSGKPVKVRDQDVGRAVRDEENRIFYVLPKSDQTGYYGAPTRAGGPKDEQCAIEMEAKLATAQQASQAAARPPVHDATGKKRSGIGSKILLLALIAAAAAAAYLYMTQPEILDSLTGP